MYILIRSKVGKPSNLFEALQWWNFRGILQDQEIIQTVIQIATENIRGEVWDFLVQ